ncbi:chaperone protein DnaJ, putative [Acanthamoeba castellanii str. Neff]|uniref:Chaperone protein DnaJ, putative n=1 Tax=Acanthamoeba castellanii (strain ATCC 30010 / Neff) TaxID=1257118 RepID=L8HG44_ACACF|nr:chaperone protein DnaJ, putative [Acanthamoeba castellanii str. Neff]ELR23698.1 chaperone protein DnaJ, putative [Acanthamoeba castellanii str. Neff]
MEGPEEIEEGTDLYGLLGVKKTASKNEIRKAYRKLARTFHPDHHGGDVRGEAEKKFVQINYAYVVLMDDEQRAVYDIYGLEALKSNTCKELVKRYPTLDELKKHLEKVEKDKELKELRNKFKMKGKITTVLGAFKRGPEEFNLPFILGNQIDTRNMVVVGGNVAQRGSSLIFGWRRFFSDVDRTTFADAQVVAGPEAWNLRVIGQTRLSSSNVGAIIADINNEGSNLTLHFWETLSERVLGDAQFSIGQNNVMRLGLRRQAKTTVMSSHLKFADVEYVGDWPFSIPSLELNYRKKLSKRESLSLETELGFGGLPSVGLGYTRRISKGNKLSISTGLGANGACTVIATYTYFGQQFSFPLLVTRGLEGWTSVGAFVLPLFGVLAATQFWFNPLRERKKREKKAATLRLRSEHIKKKRQQAEMDIRLILAQVKRKIEAERTKHGLVIVLGQYGRWKEPTPSGDEEEAEEGSVIDVTVPLQYRVEDSQLILEEGSKASLYGFYDPCPGDEKQLRIRYLFKDKMHHVTINDNDELVIPLKEHLVKETYKES